MVGHLCGILGRGVMNALGKNALNTKWKSIKIYCREWSSWREKHIEKIHSLTSKVKEGKENATPSTRVVLEDHPFYTSQVNLDIETEASIMYKTKEPLETTFQNKNR